MNNKAKLYFENKKTTNKVNVSKEKSIILSEKLKKYYLIEDISEKKLCKKTLLFLKFGADINFSNKYFSFLDMALYNNFNELAKLLIENGANIFSYEYPRSAPLYTACMKGNYEMVRILCDLGAAKNYINIGNPILIDMLKSENEIVNQNSIIKYLFKSGYKNDEKDISNQTPLFYAANNNDKEVVEILLKNGANPLVKSHHNEKTAYDIAITKNLEMANLIEHYEEIWKEKQKQEEIKEAKYNAMFEEIINDIKENKEKNKQSNAKKELEK